MLSTYRRQMTDAKWWQKLTLPLARWAKKQISEIRKQTDQAEKTIILHQDEIMAALKSIQGSTIFVTATKFKKMMSDFNFKPIPSEIKYFIPEKETVNDIPNLFGTLQKMKIPQVQSDIDFEVVNSYPPV